ncbi:hypothetical protein M422DRAFT_261695, partial [Sphaerobolus stellatus SS14]
MANLSSGTEKQLSKLKLLLEHLPTSLPAPDPATSQYPFVGYEPDPDDVELTGSVVGALNKAFEVIFGFKSRSEGDGIIPIKERGPGICAVVDVLSSAFVKEPFNALLNKWVEDLTLAANKIYNQEGVHVPTSDTASMVGKRLREESEDDKNTMEAKNDENDEEDLDGINVADLVHISNPLRAKVKKGRPVNADLVKLTILFKDPKIEKYFYRCVGEGCHLFRKGRPQRDRVLKHATSCIFLKEDLKDLANDMALENAPGNEVSDEHSRLKGHGLFETLVSENDEPANKKQKSANGPKQQTLEQSVAKVSQENLQKSLELIFVKLICVHGMVPTLIDVDPWKDMLKLLNPKAPIVSSDTVQEKLI